MKPFEVIFLALMGVYLVVFPIGFYYCMRWALTAGQWFWRFKREHGLWKTLLLFYNPFQSWPTIRRIRREVPGADKIWKRASISVFAGFALFGLMYLLWYFGHGSR